MGLRMSLPPVLALPPELAGFRAVVYAHPMLSVDGSMLEGQHTYIYIYIYIRPAYNTDVIPHKT